MCSASTPALIAIISSDFYMYFAGILVSSDEHIIVQTLNAGKFMSDGFCVPPISQLGLDHIAVTYKYSSSNLYQVS